MPKGKNELKIQALTLYRQGLKLIEIAKQLGVPDGTVRRWKCTDKWDNERSVKKKANVRKKGGQPANTNAEGHGAPKRNTNAVKHGLFAKYLPKESLDIIEAMKDKSPLDLIWDAIQIQYAAIIRSQQIMYVKDIDDSTTTKTGYTDGNTSGEQWEVQQSWDKQASFLKAQSKAIDSLKNMVKDYLELEGANKADSKEQVQDWKASIIEIARRREMKNMDGD